MDDLISRSALLEKKMNVGLCDAYGDYYGCGDVVLTDDIKAAPAIDAVEVVRCYKCKQSERMASPYGTVLHCHFWNKTVDYDGFCHEGY